MSFLEKIWPMCIISEPVTVKRYKWVKVFKNGPNKICGRHPLKNLK